jgi:flagellin-like hook-associated protein FlgL
MKKLITGYNFNSNSGIVRLIEYSDLLLENFLLITNVTQNKIIYNFADPNAGGYITGTNNDSLQVNYITSGVMTDSDRLQIFYDVPNEKVDLASGYLTGYSGTTGLYSPVYPVEMQNVGGRAVDVSSGFYPNYGRNDAVSFNFDKDNGGALAFQADLDKDIDSVTTFDIGYGSVSNYLTGLISGTSSSGVGTQVISGNSNRITLFGQNFGTFPLYVKYGLGCNVGSFNFILYPGVSEFDGRGEKFSDDRYKGDISVNTLSGSTGQYIFWEGV